MTTEDVRTPETTTADAAQARREGRARWQARYDEAVATGRVRDAPSDLP